MSYGLYLAVVWIHLFAAATWVGGMVFIAVAIPAIRSLGGQGIDLLERLVRRFSAVGWVSLGLLAATGALLLGFRGYDLAAVVEGRLFQGGFGAVLTVKLSLFGATVAVGVLHDFFIGPRAIEVLRSPNDPAKTEYWRRLAAWVGRVNFLLGVAILGCGVLLVRGLPG